MECSSTLKHASFRLYLGCLSPSLYPCAEIISTVRELVECLVGKTRYLKLGYRMSLFALLDILAKYVLF